MVAISFIGIGSVGAALANRLQLLGYPVTIAARNPASASVQDALAKNPNLLVVDPATAVARSDIIFLATPFNAFKGALEGLDVKDKIIVDCTNPVSAGPKHGLESVISGAETIQQAVPDAHVVKSFTIYGYENLEDANFPDGKPTMLYCGNNAEAKVKVAKLIEDLGYEPVDTGDASTALHLEHLTLLWIKMCRIQGKPKFAFKTLHR